MNRLIAGAMALALAGCGGGSAPASAPTPAVGATQGPARLSVTVGQEFRLHIGESATVGGISSTVTFNHVQSDSRCPTGAQCVQAGSAEVALDVTGAAARSLTLSTDAASRQAPLGSAVIRLVSLTPLPGSAAVPPSQYVATLCVCRP